MATERFLRDLTEVYVTRIREAFLKKASVFNLLRLKSDHHLVFVVLNKDHEDHRRRSPFRGEAAWFMSPTFDTLMNDS